MPVYTKVQSYAVSVLRNLRSVRHDQMHWLIGREYPNAKVPPAAEMRRLVYLGKAVNDGKHYCWPGCALDAELIIALDVMIKAAGGDNPLFELKGAPCKLSFSVIKDEKNLACSVFFPKPGEERETAAAVVVLPPGQTAVIHLESLRQMPLFSIKRPHIFVRSLGDDEYEYIKPDTRSEVKA